MLSKPHASFPLFTVHFLNVFLVTSNVHISSAQLDEFSQAVTPRIKPVKNQILCAPSLAGTTSLKGEQCQDFSHRLGSPALSLLISKLSLII